MSYMCWQVGIQQPRRKHGVVRNEEEAEEERRRIARGWTMANLHLCPALRVRFLPLLLLLLRSVGESPGRHLHALASGVVL